MRDGTTATFKVRWERGRGSERRLVEGEAPPAPVVPSGRTPRVAKLMALAIRFDRLVRTGQVQDFAELARLGGVTRARLSQIVDLVNLAPDLQEAILGLPDIAQGKDPITETHVRSILRRMCWQEQRCRWRDLLSATTTGRATI
ncbi:MAG: hypothetical protein IT436_13410 [Phycisphaerales bacterium]|nr:hypothetical protein [Phycisphaerales bacterium]